MELKSESEFESELESELDPEWSYSFGEDYNAAVRIYAVSKLCAL